MWSTLHPLGPLQGCSERRSSPVIGRPRAISALACLLGIPVLLVTLVDATVASQTGWHPAQIVTVRCPDNSEVYTPLCKLHCERGGAETTVSELEVNCMPYLDYEYEFNIYRWKHCIADERWINDGPSPQGIDEGWGWSFWNYTQCLNSVDSVSTVEHIGELNWFEQSYVLPWNGQWKDNPEIVSSDSILNPKVDDMNFARMQRRRRLTPLENGGWSMRIRKPHSLPVVEDIDWHHPTVTHAMRRELLGLDDDENDDDHWETVTHEDELTIFGKKSPLHKVQKTELGDLHFVQTWNTPLSVYGKRGLLRQLGEMGEAGCDMMYTFSLHNGLINCPAETGNCTWDLDAGRGDLKTNGRLKPTWVYSSSVTPSIRGTPTALVTIQGGNKMTLRNDTGWLIQQKEINPVITWMSAYWGGFCSDGAWFDRSHVNDALRRLLEKRDDSHLRRLMDLDPDTATKEELDEVISDEVFERLTSILHDRVMPIASVAQARNSEFFFDKNRPVRRLHYGNSDREFEKMVHVRYGPRRLLSHSPRRTLSDEELEEHSRRLLADLPSHGVAPFGVFRDTSNQPQQAPSRSEPAAADRLLPSLDSVAESESDHVPEATTRFVPVDSMPSGLTAASTEFDRRTPAAAAARRLQLFEMYTHWPDWEYKGPVFKRHWKMAPRWDRMAYDNQSGVEASGYIPPIVLRPILDTYSNLYSIPEVNREFAFPYTFMERISEIWPRPWVAFQERRPVNGGNFCASLKDCALCQAAINCDWCLTADYQYHCVDYCLDKWIQLSCDSHKVYKSYNVKTRNGAPPRVAPFASLLLAVTIWPAAGI